jgi:predicted transcriptional regulator
MDPEALGLSRRREIYTYISQHPGTYLREMEKTLSLSVGDLQYHLSQLEKAGLISFQDDGRYKHYFVKDVGVPDREVLSVIKLRTPRRIVVYLLLHPGSSFKEVLAQFPFTKGALSFHLKKLIKTGVITSARREKELVYKVRDELHVSQILVTYQAGFLDEAVDGFVDLWTKL